MITKSGKEIAMYYPNGEPIKDLSDFIDFYSKCYYIENNKEVEDVIDTILKNGIGSEIDLYRVLAWKFGKIDMKKSRRDSFVYYEEMNEKFMKFRIYSNNEIIYKEEIIELYENVIKQYANNCKTEDVAQNFMDALKDYTDSKAWGKYFYSVYMITLLFFVSNGTFPIVDSFAYVALEAINNNIAYGERINYPGIARRNIPEEYNNIVTKGNYANYRTKLNELFAEKAESRKVDQALWVYGKLFKK